MRSFFTILLKTLVYTLLVILLVLGVVIVALQTPLVQTRLVGYFTKELSMALHFPITIRQVAIKWFDTVTLEGVRIQNRDQSPMIDVGRLEVNFDLQNLLDSASTTIHLDEVLLFRPQVSLVKNSTNGNLNLDEFITQIDKLLTKDPTKPSIPDQNVPFTIGKGTIIEGQFSYNDQGKPCMTGQRIFDYNHFALHDINGSFRNFLVLGDTIAATVNRLKTVDKRANLTLHRLDARFLYCRKQMRLDGLLARINGSTLRNNATFSYDDFSAFNNFNDKVVMRVNLHRSLIRAQDLVPFTSYFHSNFDIAQADGFFIGTIHQFRFQRADIRFGRNSRLTGDLAFTGLPNVDRTIVDFRFKPSSVQLTDLKPYYSDPTFDRLAEKLGVLRFASTFTGTFRNFMTMGTFESALGSVAGELALNLSGPQQTTYRGNLTIQNVDVGKLIDHPELLQCIDGQGRFEGRGLTVKDASLDLDARFSRVGFKQYNYRQLYIRGNLQQSFFNGQVTARDTNLNLSIDGEFDLRGPRNLFDFRGTVQHANLLTLHLVDDTVTVRAKLDIRLEGNTLDEIIGRAQLRDSYLTYGKRTLVVDTLHISSSIVNRERIITLDSDFLSANLQGNFQLTQTATDLQRLYREYQMNFAGTAGILLYYQLKQGPFMMALPTPYSVTYSILLKNSRPLLELLYPSISISPNTFLDGRFSVGRTSFLTLNGTIDTLQIQNYAFYKSMIDLNTSKFINTPDILASLIVSSAQQRLGSMAPTEEFQMEASWQKNHIDFTSNIRQQQSTNRADLNGTLTFRSNAMEIELERSHFRLLDSIWTISPRNLISLSGQDITVSNLAISNKNQLISAEGVISTDSLKEFRIETRNFQVQTLNSLLNTTISGTANGYVALRGLYTSTVLDGAITIDSLTYHGFLIGNLSNRSVFDASNRVNIDTRIQRLGREVLVVTGTYDTRMQAVNPLDLRAILNQVDLRVLEPFFRRYVSNLSGTATGTVTVSGQINHPVLGGSVDVKGGRLTIDYLKMDASFEDKIYFGPNEIVARRMTLTDPSGNKATLRGGVFHDGYKYFTLSLNVDMKNFQILNTTNKDNNLFYGTAVVTGKAELYGPIDNLTIRANVVSNRGTRMIIPLDQAADVSQEEVIRFVNHHSNVGQSKSSPHTIPAKDPDQTREAIELPKEQQVDLSGINMDFNLSLTPDAYCEIQLDRQAGDMIKAYGNGQVAMKIDTKGDFTMTGSYEINQGEYLFTFENIINKRFQILPNSRITWIGDPYEAQVDIKSSYTQYTSLAPLLQSGSNSVDRNRRFPVDLLINLKGRLLAPEITYDLKVKEYPQQADFRQAVITFESRLKSNDQELGRQVSGILLFNQLVPSDGSSFLDPTGTSNNLVGSGVTNSLSELVSNQISRLASTLDKNLDVGLSLNGLDQNVVNNLQLRFSYRFNDRFRISRDGGFTYGANQTSVASLLGEWTLEYLLTSNGRLRLRMYNRNQQNLLGQFGSLSYGTLTTGGGMSIQYSRSFNRLFGRPIQPTRPGIQAPPPDEQKSKKPPTSLESLVLE